MRNASEKDYPAEQGCWKSTTSCCHLPVIPVTVVWYYRRFSGGGHFLATLHVTTWVITVMGGYGSRGDGDVPMLLRVFVLHSSYILSHTANLRSQPVDPAAPLIVIFLP